MLLIECGPEFISKNSLSLSVCLPLCLSVCLSVSVSLSLSLLADVSDAGQISGNSVDATSSHSPQDGKHSCFQYFLFCFLKYGTKLVEKLCYNIKQI